MFGIALLVHEYLPLLNASFQLFDVVAGDQKTTLQLPPLVRLAASTLSTMILLRRALCGMMTRFLYVLQMRTVLGSFCAIKLVQQVVAVLLVAASVHSSEVSAGYYQHVLLHSSTVLALFAAPLILLMHVTVMGHAAKALRTHLHARSSLRRAYGSGKESVDTGSVVRRSASRFVMLSWHVCTGWGLLLAVSTQADALWCLCGIQDSKRRLGLSAMVAMRNSIGSDRDSAGGGNAPR